MQTISLQGIRKTFGNTVAVDSIDLEIAGGDLFFLLGPSGCGKTTLLRMIAGFIEPTAGTIRIGDKDVTNVPPNKRNTGMVFQSYALWPHMTVHENVAFGLKVRKIPQPEIKERVAKALELVRMGEYGTRKPNELSGGQQQRVALARALVFEPDVLLLDEPLSNLDAKLRLEMRSEIRRICSETRMTTVYVTHDQKEALSMADDMVVLRDGLVMQRGRPRDLYHQPGNRFTADFLGETNFMAGTVAESGGDTVVIETSSGRLSSSTFHADCPGGGNVTASIRPESFRILREQQDTAGNSLSGRRIESTYLGEVAQHVIELQDGTRLKVLEMNPRAFGEPGETIRLCVDPEDVVILTD
ncbi:MAG: spermidine/putrescine ABC transporter ATP-binding protein [Phycisphaerae bacterium]|nr:spermidine/putrescine ABC transporter ATP-binding protein [Phycisphaerae bacterium]